MTTTARTPLLNEEMLRRFDERAPRYDRENAFFAEDWEELKSAGFLLAAVPLEFGGSGLSLDHYLDLLRQIAYHAPATALATNMHCYWTGVAADLLKAGDRSCQWLLELAAQGEVFCALHGEPGNEVPLLLATSTANRTSRRLGSIRTQGIPAACRRYGPTAGFMPRTIQTPAQPRIVHGFVGRHTPGVSIVNTWDTLGMRATQSQDTLLDKAFVPDEHVVLICPAGFAGAGLFQLSIFAWALLGFSATYLGAARRALDLTIEQLPKRTSIALPNSMAHHPEVQHNVAEMRMAYDAAEALLERTSGDWAAGVAHADWPVRLIGTRHFVIDQCANAIVNHALDLSGGAGTFKRNRIEQLFRDVRMGSFHPGNRLLAPELVGKMVLGVDPDAQPRWG